MSRRLSAIFLAASALLSLPVAGVAQAQQQLQPVERIAAIVEEDVILQSELDLALRIDAEIVGLNEVVSPTILGGDLRCHDSKAA